MPTERSPRPMPEPTTHRDDRAATFAGAALLEALVVAALAFVVGLSFFRQGIDLGSDGLWLLGTDGLVKGRGLYGALETGDGPARYWWLAPFYLLRDDAGALALLRAAGLALAGGLSVAWLRHEGVGRVRWLAPLGLFALTPADPGLGLLLLTALLLALRPRRTLDAALGMLLVAALALDLRWAGAVSILLVVDLGARRPPRNIAELGLGILGGLVLFLVAVPATGELAAVLRNSFVHPWHRLGQHFAESGASRWWETLHDGLWVHVPYSGLGTGESLQPLVPGHAALRAGAFRGMTLVGLTVPLLFFVRHLRRPVPRSTALAVLLSSAWILLSRGDAPALTAAYALPWLLLLREQRNLGRRVGAALLVVASLAWLPLVLEAGWLSTRVDRPELTNWPRAGVDVAEERQLRLEEFFSRLGPATSRPMVIWPDQAGLHQLFDIPPAVPYVQLGGLDLPDGTRSEALVQADPQVVLLAQSWSLTAQALRAEDPVLWSTVRERFRVAGWLRGRTDRLRLLVRMEPDQSLATLSLAQRLPLVELTVTNETSPALRRDLTIGQSFHTGDQDLEGFVVRWSTDGTNLEFPVRVRVWQKTGQEFDALLSARTVRIEVPGDGARSFVRMPVEETSNLELAITLEVTAAPPQEVRLQWHRHDVGGQDVDLFEDGSALLNLEPVDADLYFVLY